MSRLNAIIIISALNRLSLLTACMETVFQTIHDTIPDVTVEQSIGSANRLEWIGEVRRMKNLGLGLLMGLGEGRVSEIIVMKSLEIPGERAFEVAALIFMIVLKIVLVDVEKVKRGVWF